MLRRICLSTSTALALAATPAYAVAAPVVNDAAPTTGAASGATPVVAQGDLVDVVGKGRCTIAFNDRGQNVSYTAGHCGEKGDRAIVMGEGFRASGTFHPSSAMNADEGTANDWGVIRWADGVKLGENGITGDEVVAPSLMRSGDPVCVYGGTSKKTTCGSFAGAIGNNLYWDGPSGKPGDSGGPVWVEGKGFLSIYTGVSMAVGSKGEQARLNRSSVPVNGPQVSPEEEMELLAQAKRITTPVAHETAVPGGKSEQVNNGGSSDMSAVGITAIVLVALAGVLFTVPQIVGALPPQYREPALRIMQAWGS